MSAVGAPQTGAGGTVEDDEADLLRRLEVVRACKREAMGL